MTRLGKWYITYIGLMAMVCVAAIVAINTGSLRVREYIGPITFGAYALIVWIAHVTAPPARRTSMKTLAVIFTIGAAILLVQAVIYFQ